MKDYCVSFLYVLTGLLLCAMAAAQENVPDQVATGEAGYKIGCSAAATLGIVACGELPSGKLTQKEQAPTDVNAAIAETEKLNQEAATISAAIAQAVQNLQQQGSPDSAEVSAALE